MFHSKSMFWPRFGTWLVFAFVACVIAWFNPAIDPVRYAFAGDAYVDFAQALGCYGALGAAIGTAHGAVARAIEHRHSHYAVDTAASQAREFLLAKRKTPLAADTPQPLPGQKSKPAAKSVVSIVSAKQETTIPQTLRK